MTNEVWAVRYGTRVTTRTEAYLNWHVYGEPDESFRMDYFFWIVRGGGRTTVVDCGFDPEVGRRRGREVLVDPVDALAALGIDAGDGGPARGQPRALRPHRQPATASPPPRSS